MALNEECKNFRDIIGYEVEDTYQNLKNNYYLPIINEEKAIIEEHDKALFGKLGCGGAFSMGCLIPVIAASLLSSLPFFCGFWGKVILQALLITLIEYFAFVYYKNIEFNEEHRDNIPSHIDLINKLIQPLTAIISQDQKPDTKFKLKTNLTEITKYNNKLSSDKIKEMGKALKRGLSVFEKEVLELSTILADNTKVTYNIKQLLCIVDVHKKHGSKHSEKGKITLKAVFVFPNNVYAQIPEGDFTFGEYDASVIHSDKTQKIVLKEVFEDTKIDGEFLTDNAINMIAAVYSLLEAN